MASYKDLNERAVASKGIVVPVSNAIGNDTGQWIRLRHVWSNEFIEAGVLATVKRNEAIMAADGDKVTELRAAREAQIESFAALIAEWSYEEELTIESAQDFIRSNPQVEDGIDKIAGDKSRFFGNDSASSEAGSSQSAS